MTHNLNRLFGFTEPQAIMIEQYAQHLNVSLELVLVAKAEDGDDLGTLFGVESWYYGMVGQAWFNLLTPLQNYIKENDCTQIYLENTRFPCSILDSWSDYGIEMNHDTPTITGVLNGIDLTDFSDENLLLILTSIKAIEA